MNKRTHIHSTKGNGSAVARSAMCLFDSGSLQAALFVALSGLVENFRRGRGLVKRCPPSRASTAAAPTQSETAD